MAKKKIILIVAIIIIILMLIPIPVRWKNGVIEYKAILYKYTNVHIPSDISFTGYEDGWELKILGLRVGGNINVDEILRVNDNNVQKDVGNVTLEVKEDTRTSKGATFIIKNNTEDDYSYGLAYSLEKFDNRSWKELNTFNGETLSWDLVVFTLKAREEVEINIDWSAYGKLESGTYRLVKSDLRKLNSPESRTYTVYAEFDIK